MDYVTLGATKERVSRIAFGCAAIGGFDYGMVDDEQSITAVRGALDLGVTLFDTADVYGFGHSEEILGRALVGRRHEAFVATKVGVAFDQRGQTRRDLSASWIRQAVDASLTRLRTDVIDLYQIHWPDNTTPLAETMDALVELQRIGKVRYLGVCNADAAWLERVLTLARVETVQTSYNLTDWKLGSELYRALLASQMTLLTYNSLAQGMLTGKYDAQSRFSGTDRRQRSAYFNGPHQDALLAALDRVRSVAGQSRTCTQVALRWVLDTLSDGCAIAGIKTEGQMRDVVSACGWHLSEAELDLLRQKVSLAISDT